MEVVRSVAFRYEPNPLVEKLLRDFRDMVNFCIEKALRIRSTSLSKLHRACYRELRKRWGYEAMYCSMAYRIASSVIRSWKRRKREKPVVRKLFVRLHKQLFKLLPDGRLVVSAKGSKVELRLIGGDYQRKFLRLLDEGKLRHGEVILNERYAIVPFIQEIDLAEPEKAVAIDLNLTNVTAVTSEEA